MGDPQHCSAAEHRLDGVTFHGAGTGYWLMTTTDLLVRSPVPDDGREGVRL